MGSETLTGMSVSLGGGACVGYWNWIRRHGPELFGATLLLAVVVIWTQVCPLRYEREAWRREVIPRMRSVRVRMADDVVAWLRREKPTRDKVLSELGPGTTESPLMLKYALGGVFRKFLYLRFDETGVFYGVDVVPE